MAHKKTEKEVLLFIVEGSHDETALAMPLENLQKSCSSDGLIQIGVTHGDITSDYKVNNVAHEVVKYAKKYCEMYKLKKSDIIKVVLLLDMDGAYIPDDAVIRSDTHERAFYSESQILHKCPEDIKKTHKLKQSRVNNLVGLKHVWGNIPFSAYFVSCNLDHVICGNANLTLQEKRNITDDFSLKYGEDAEGFLSFFCNSGLVLGETYDESWDAIKINLNSLKRFSNMNVFFDMHYLHINHISAKELPR